ncbi:MAG: FAD-dependent oxidoreductase [Alphaproteobacteria bacterium]|nr:FAD-dependent oxidoreductase [Alphaproteobacteria bacterium]
MTGGRTPLFRALRRALQLARAAAKSGIPADEIAGVARARGLTRRRFLGGTVVSAAALLAATRGVGAFDAVGPAPTGPAAFPALRGGPRIAIVGAGMAGLTAAWTLRRAGLEATIFEASERTGGRIRSARNVVGEGFVTELGAEFIDTPHVLMLRFAAELGLDLIDVSTDDGMAEIVWFDGVARDEAALVAALLPVIGRLAADQESLPSDVTYAAGGPVAERFDRMSLAEYLSGLADAEPWMRDLLRVAYVTEYGGDAEAQSAINLLDTFSWSRGEWSWFGDSDERFKVAGGNQLVADGLAARLDGAIRLGHRLVAVRPSGRGYRLDFATDGGTVAATADCAILTLPFTRLREVEIAVPVSRAKRAAIDGLGYGTNAKLFLGFARRPWRDAKASGNFFAADPLQSGWDSTRLQAGLDGGLTLFSGGRIGATLAARAAAERAVEALPLLDRVFPGAAAAFNGRAALFDWPGHAHTRGSYACFAPGQWTTIRGLEGEPVGNLLFAGEHCSADFQGFMEGAAETGRAAATAIAARL